MNTFTLFSLSTVFILFGQLGCATKGMEKENLSMPPSWSGYRDGTEGYPSEEFITNVAELHLSSLGYNLDEVPRDKIKIVYPSVVAERLKDFQMIMVIAPLSVKSEETRDLVDTRQIIMDLSGKIISSESSTMEVRTTQKHGAPW
jgi:hypothetical protein